MVNQTQALPYSRADVRLLPDEEDSEQYREAALQACLTHAGDGQGISELMHAVPEVAQHAAAAAAYEWCVRWRLRPEDERLTFDVVAW